MAALTEGIKGRHQTVLAELTEEFDQRLAKLQAPNLTESQSRRVSRLPRM